MASTRSPNEKSPVVRWNLLWLGTGYSRRGLINLFWSIVRFWLAVWLWGIGLRLAHFPPPLKTVGAALAILSLAIFLWAILEFSKGIRHLGLKNFVLALSILYVVLVAFNVLTVPDNRPFQHRVIPQFVETSRQVWTLIFNAFSFAAGAPDDFLFAYTGSSVVSRPPGFPTPHPNATQVLVIAEPARLTDSVALKVGGYARVATSESQLLNVWAGPGQNHDVVTSFPKGERLLILEGPESNAEGKWWKVHGPQGEGWCVEKGLIPSD